MRTEFPLTWPAAPSILTTADALDYVSGRTDAIRSAVEEHGAILFRGFPLHGPADFGLLVAAAGVELMDYHEIGGGGVRVNEAAGVYTTIDDIAPDARQSPHHERARSSELAKVPARLALYCEIPADAGGETAICRSTSIAERLRSRHPRLFAKLGENRLRYCKTFFDERYSPAGTCPTCRQGHTSWQEVRGTRSKDDALRGSGRGGVTWEFHDDDLVRRGGLTVYRGICAPEQSGGRTICWTHKMNERPCNEWVEYEDGTVMHAHEQECVRRIAMEDEVKVAWRPGDFLLLDNFTVQHSKCPHAGDRRVYVTMGN
jgi:hypothetical protein